MRGLRTNNVKTGMVRKRAILGNRFCRDPCRKPRRKPCRNEKFDKDYDKVYDKDLLLGFEPGQNVAHFFGMPFISPGSSDWTHAPTPVYRGIEGLQARA